MFVKLKGRENYAACNSGRKEGKQQESKRTVSSAGYGETIELDVTALGQSTLDNVKGQLLAFVDDKVAESVEINDQSVAAMSDRCQRAIMSLESDAHHVRITIGM